MTGFPLLVAFAAFVAVSGRAEEPYCADALFATSNQWGTSVREHRASVYGAISQGAADENGPARLRQWYVNLSAYPTADISTPSGRLWKVEQTMLLMLYGDSEAVARSTNCWFAAADCMGRLRSLERPGLEAEVLLFGTGNITNENQEAFLLQMSAYDDMREGQRALSMMESNVLRVVTNAFPRQIFPMLPVGQCHGLATNVAERARLSLEEMALVENLAERSGQRPRE